MERRQLIDLVPLYALDALEGAEMQEFESHLEACQECPAELAVHQSVATALTADLPAPPGVWDRIAIGTSDRVLPIQVARLAERRLRRDPKLFGTALGAALASMFRGTVGNLPSRSNNRDDGA